MAVLVKTARLRSGNGMSRLAIVNVKTGASRLVPGTALSTNGGAYSGGDTYWALWLPGGRQILAGAVANCVAASAYAVDTRKLGARPFSFFEEGTDGFSAIVLR